VKNKEPCNHLLCKQAYNEQRKLKMSYRSNETDRADLKSTGCVVGGVDDL